MAEETLKPTMENDPKATIVDVKDVPEAEVNPPTKEEETSPVKTEEKEEVVTETKAMLVGDETKDDSLKTIEEKVEENSQLSVNETKALVEFKKLLQDAINNREFQTQAPVVEETKPEEAPVAPEKAEKAEEEAVVETVKVEEEKKEVVVEEEEAGTKTVEAIEETIVSSLSPETEEKDNDEKVQEKLTMPMPPLEEVSIWGVPLLKDERTDTILWKFLQARDFKVSEAMQMLKNTLKWRKEFGIDALIEEGGDDVEDGDLAKAVFMHGVSKEGSPVCYNVYGVFQDKEVYERLFGDEEKREKFLKVRILMLEKSVRKLDFSPGGVSTIVQVNDLKNSPGLGKWELRHATKHALHLLQDNYPEFVAKQVFVNVPWWYVAVNKMISPFLTQRTKSKFVLATGPSKSAETLFNYIAPEQVPVQYGGLSRKGEFGTKDGATQIIVKAASKETVEFAVNEACHLTWEIRVLGWEVSYGAEFVPSTKDGYTVIIQKIRKVGPTEETIVTSSFKTSEPGKVVLTIDNSSSKKKRLLYRLKSVPFSE